MLSERGSLAFLTVSIFSRWNLKTSAFQIHSNYNIFDLNNQENQWQIPFDYTPDLASKPYQ